MSQANNTPAGYNQVTSTGSAFGLGSGISTLTAVTVVSGGTGYSVGDIVQILGGTGLPAQVDIVTVGPNGTVTSVIQALANGCYSSSPSGTLSTTNVRSNGSGLTLSGTFTSGTIPKNATGVLIQAEAQNLRWRDDGVNPTATVGTIILDNDTVPYLGNLSAIQLIQTTSGSIANITFLAP